MSGKSVAKTPKQLMRARFSAYTIGGHGQYLMDTWHPAYSRGNTANSLSLKTHDWRSLQILQAGQDGDKGGVEFVADFVDNQGVLQRHHEMSYFERHKGRWYYTDGRVDIRPIEQAKDTG
ncbi:MAG TPA: hypothetical protein DDZ21_13920 [Gammaproteobacteria bacterium]|nr:hypothetical protein [Gammaproteobacteria bacterium]